MIPPEATARKAYLRLYTTVPGDPATRVLSVDVLAPQELLDAVGFATAKGQGGINVQVTRLELVAA